MIETRKFEIPKRDYFKIILLLQLRNNWLLFLLLLLMGLVAYSDFENLISKYFLLFIATNPQISNRATMELINAFAWANTCGLNPGFIFVVVRLNTDIAIKIITEKDTIRVTAFRSFFFQLASSIS